MAGTMQPDPEDDDWFPPETEILKIDCDPQPGEGWCTSEGSIFIFVDDETEPRNGLA